MRNTKEYRKHPFRKVLLWLLCCCLLTGSVLQVQATETETETETQTENTPTSQTEEDGKSALDDIRESIEDVENEMGQISGELDKLEDEKNQAQNAQTALEKNKSDMEKYLDITPGAVSVMGLMNDTENAVQLLIDEDILSKEWLGCHPCVNTACLRLKTQDVIEIFLPAVRHGYRVVRLTGSVE